MQLLFSLFITAIVGAAANLLTPPSNAWASTNSFVLVLAPANVQPSDYSLIASTCVATCAQTGFTATQASSGTSVTFIPGASSPPGCTCPTSTGTASSSSTSLAIISNIITPPTPGYPPATGTVNLVVTSAGFAQVQVASSGLLNFYIGGCQTTNSLTSPCRGSATFRYTSDTLPSSFGNNCQRACATSSYTFILSANGGGLFTPDVGAISASCTCIPIFAQVTGTSAITIEGNVPGEVGVTYGTSPISSSTSSLTFTIYTGSSPVGAITYSVSNCNGVVAAYCTSSNIIGDTTAKPVNGQTVGQATTGGSAAYNPNAAALNPAAASSSSATGAIVGGIVGGIVGIALIVVAVLFFLGKLSCGVKTAASIASSSPNAKVGVEAAGAAAKTATAPPPAGAAAAAK